MRHVVLLNVAGRGYSTYAGSPHEGFALQPLGVETARVSRSLLAASHALDDAVRQGRRRVSVEIRHEPGARPFIAYGTFLPAALDEKGRAGLVFVHAVEFDVIEALGPTLGAVIETLRDDALDALDAAVTAVARDAAEIDALLDRVCGEVARRVPAVTPPMLALGAEAAELGAIEHDCAGAAPVAWLTLAHVMSSRAPGWSIADHEANGRVYTRVRGAYGDPRKTLRASEVLAEGVKEYLLRGLDESLRAERSTQSDVPTAVSTLEEPQRAHAEPVTPRVETVPLRPARPPAWMSVGAGALAGAVFALATAAWVASWRGSSSRECDGGAATVAQETVCDASAGEVATPPAARVWMDAGSAREHADVVVAEDAKRHGARAREAGRARHPDRGSGEPTLTRDRPTIHN